MKVRRPSTLLLAAAAFVGLLAFGPWIVSVAWRVLGHALGASTANIHRDFTKEIAAMQIWLESSTGMRPHDDAVRIKRDATSLFASPRIAEYSLEYDGQRLSLSEPGGTAPGSSWSLNVPEQPAAGEKDTWLVRSDG